MIANQYVIYYKEKFIKQLSILSADKKENLG